MKIDLTQQFLNADDTPAIAADTKKPIDLRFVLIQAVLSEMGGNGQPVPNDEKAKRYDLYRTLKKAGPVVELSVEDIALLKAAVKPWPTLVVGQAHEMLEHEYVESSFPRPEKRHPSFDPDSYKYADAP